MALLKLSGLLAEPRKLESPRKMQTALFLAQQSSGCDLYRFRVSKGKVISDELDQDLAQLEAGGWIAILCSVPRGRSELVINPRPGSLLELTPPEENLKQVLLGFFAEDADVLEAAATLAYSAQRANTRALKSLRWLRQLGDDTLGRAQRVLEEIDGNWEGNQAGEPESGNV